MNTIKEAIFAACTDEKIIAVIEFKKGCDVRVEKKVGIVWVQ
jgi:hypothetical protein